ncbi:MAG: cytoplasmic iron level regulating protein YaaA (DUF328/UPF0246 family) [Alphaproteobacteria bacterium]|jgi:cytoplasmic iron level regulating protein YaaA (DUF328/UPF0246 family)
MLVVVSPAKNLDFTSPLPTFLNGEQHATLATTQPLLIENVKALVKTCKKLSPADLSSMMKISDKLAILNAERFSSFEFPFTNDNARPAMYAFNGDVYTGLDAKSLDENSVTFAQSHLRILSGLYGTLKPLDLMQAYRLEMGIKLKVGKTSTLYQYWNDTITTELNNALKAQGDKVLINLASNEYFSSVKPTLLDATIVTPQFKNEKNGKFKIISFYAKKARGLMARYIIEHKVEDVSALQKFDIDGYYFDDAESTATDLVFKRAER